MHMGAENVAPLLYSLLRFVKPTSALEVGGGFTSIFLLQALEDNAAEVARYRQLRAAGQDRVGDSGTQWSCDAFFAPSSAAAGDSMADRVEKGLLHCIDNMAHEHTTANKCARKLSRAVLHDSAPAVHSHSSRAHYISSLTNRICPVSHPRRVVDVARALGVDHRLRLHVNDAFDPDLPATLAPGVTFDFMCVRRRCPSAFPSSLQFVCFRVSVSPVPEGDVRCSSPIAAGSTWARRTASGGSSTGGGRACAPRAATWPCTARSPTSSRATGLSACARCRAERTGPWESLSRCEGLATSGAAFLSAESSSAPEGFMSDDICSSAAGRLAY